MSTSTRKKKRIPRVPVGPFTPKYVGLAQQLVQHIVAQGLGPGDRLGTESELGVRYGVSRITVRLALAMLEEEGLIVRRRSLGTFVRNAPGHEHQKPFASGTIAIICSNEQAEHVEEDVAFAIQLRAIERGLAQRGHSVQIVGIGKDDQLNRVRLEQLSQIQQLEGVCAIGPCLERYADLFANAHVITTSMYYPGRFPRVGTDIQAVCRDAISHLIERGHRRIALICGDWVDRRAFALFAEGYREAFARAGLSFEMGWLCHGHPNEPIDSVVHEALTTYPARPTAVFADNSRVCQAVFSVTKNLGWSIPEDLSIVSYGRNVLSMTSPVAVSVYVPDNEGVGNKAVELLCEMIGGRSISASVNTTLPGKFVPRDSVRDLISNVDKT
jgi:GntR family transcriptional regulator of arabinose operon